ncbi:HEPN domain-containing protein [Aeromonas sp. 2HA2]|uniref:HEPN domain-containing protein n=1 Tax=Aeromonas sp. 2HA2 TaxID=2699194 RepID=UPI0023DDBBDD|nr:HEPN domain-containing protein [Aeromonas sp. 2HA2]
MSKAIQGFEYSIKDAEELLAHFDSINANPPPPSSEVLKRAGLVMALTAWETYVEDRLVEEMHKKLAIVQGSYLGDFILKKLHTDLKSFHNPSSDKTKKYSWIILALM